MMIIASANMHVVTPMSSQSHQSWSRAESLLTKEELRREEDVLSKGVLTLAIPFPPSDSL